MNQQDWKNIFEWSMKYNDGTAPAKAVTEEDRKWFEEAMEAAREGDATAQLKRAVNVFQEEDLDGEAGEQQLDMRQNALEALLDLVENLDNARDLKVIGGLPPLIRCMESPHESLRWQAAEIVGACVQNMEELQRWYMDGGVLPPLLTMMGDESGLCRTKALFAIGSLMRNYAPAQDAFREGGGLPRLVDCMGFERPALLRKALQMAALLCEASADDRAALAAAGAHRVAAGRLAHDDLLVREAALTLLAEVARDPGAVRECREEIGLVDKVGERLAELEKLGGEDKESAEEEMSLCRALLRALAGDEGGGGGGGGGEGDGGSKEPTLMLGA